METNNRSIVWFLIVIVFVGALVFFTRGERPSTEAQNMAKVDGLEIAILAEGNGAIAEVGNLVSVNYTGRFEDGTAFDSNVDPKFAHVEPFVFPLGTGRVIQGWDLGIAGMKIGEKRRLKIAPELAYGETGYPGAIPPNATLIFEVELLAVTK